MAVPMETTALEETESMEIVKLIEAVDNDGGDILDQLC